MTYGGGKEIIISLMLFFTVNAYNWSLRFFMILLGFPLRNLRIAKSFLFLLLYLLECSSGFWELSQCLISEI